MIVGKGSNSSSDPFLQASIMRVVHISSPSLLSFSLSISVHLYFAGVSFFFTCLQRRHAPSCLWPLTLCQGQESLCHKMSLIVYCTLVPGMMSVSVIVYKIWLLIVLFHFFQLWPSLSVTSQWRHQLFNFYKI